MTDLHVATAYARTRPGTALVAAASDPRRDAEDGRWRGSRRPRRLPGRSRSRLERRRRRRPQHRDASSGPDAMRPVRPPVGVAALPPPMPAHPPARAAPHSYTLTPDAGGPAPGAAPRPGHLQPSLGGMAAVAACAGAPLSWIRGWPTA